MSTNLIEFKCSKCRDGYRIITRSSPTKSNRARRAYYLVAASERFDQFSSLDHFPALFASFAEAPASAEGMCRFADNFGLPNSDTHGNTTEQMVHPLLREQAAMRAALAALKKGDRKGLIALLQAGHKLAGPFLFVGQSGLARLELRLRTDGGLATVIVPTNFIQGMWIQFLLHAASDAQLFRCGQCAKPFVVGSGTNRRSTAKYCSNACKVAAFKARQEA